MSEYGYEQASTLGFSAKLGVSGAQVPREIDRHDTAVEELHSVVGELEGRLVSVRLAKPEPSGPDRDQPEPIRADLAQHIAAGTSQIEQASRRLRTLLNELEI